MYDDWMRWGGNAPFTHFPMPDMGGQLPPLGYQQRTGGPGQMQGGFGMRTGGGGQLFQQPQMQTGGPGQMQPLGMRTGGPSPMSPMPTMQTGGDMQSMPRRGRGLFGDGWR